MAHIEEARALSKEGDYNMFMNNKVAPPEPVVQKTLYNYLNKAVTDVDAGTI